jgi:IclR family transcriptional regulator, acetate operon repressor
MTQGMTSFEKAIALFSELVQRGGKFDTEALCVHLGVPESTLYRHLSALQFAGMVCRSRRGVYLPNPVFLKRLEAFTSHAVLADIARPTLGILSATLGMTTHFGVLENDMVTYLAKASFDGEEVFTRENEQLEAYCSGIGKVLLATLPVDARRAYLETGPFPKLTDKTITDPAAIARELDCTQMRGFGIDSGEVQDALFCVAVPVFGPRRVTVGALSSSSHQCWSSEQMLSQRLAHMHAAADIISSALGATAPPVSLEQ